MPSLRLVWAQNQPNFRPNRQNAGNFAENPCCVYTWKLPCDRLGILSISSILPQILPQTSFSDSGKLASFQNGAPNTLCFPWKFPETQSAGDPLFSFLFSGKLLSPICDEERSERGIFNVCGSYVHSPSKLNVRTYIHSRRRTADRDFLGGGGIYLSSYFLPSYTSLEFELGPQAKIRVLRHW